MIVDLRGIRRFTLILDAEQAPVVSGLTCRARPCGDEQHNGMRVVVVDPKLPTVYVPAQGPDVVSEK